MSVGILKDSHMHPDPQIKYSYAAVVEHKHQEVGVGLFSKVYRTSTFSGMSLCVRTLMLGACGFFSPMLAR